MSMLLLAAEGTASLFRVVHEYQAGVLGEYQSVRFTGLCLHTIEREARSHQWRISSSLDQLIAFAREREQHIAELVHYLAPRSAL